MPKNPQAEGSNSSTDKTEGKTPEKEVVQPIKATEKTGTTEGINQKAHTDCHKASFADIARCKFQIWKERRKSNWKRRENAKWTDRAIVFLTVGIVALAYMQYRAMQASNEETKAALHISERAYLSIGGPQLDTSKGMVSLPLVNTGHIPSGKLTVFIHEVTINGEIADLGHAVERHWKMHALPSAPSGSPYSFAVPLPAFSEKKANAGQQKVIIAGRIGYNDGFADDIYENYLFCAQTVYQKVKKQLYWVPCEGEVVLPQLEAFDGYPNNEEKD